MMRWNKLGMMFYVSNKSEWMNSHAALPIAYNLYSNMFRIFFSVRDQRNHSQCAFVDFDIYNLNEPINISMEPVMVKGQQGSFDEHGVSVSSILFSEGLVYYLGWHIGNDAPYHNQIGLAKIQNMIFVKENRNPIIGSNENEPFSFGYPWVIKDEHKYKMWYDANFSWNIEKPKETKFFLRYAESLDGITWERMYTDCIPLEKDELYISRPCVLKEGEIYKMWYSVNRGGKYHIGYAESLDGMNWRRKDDEVGITVSESGWDSEEICYPFVFDHEGDRYMLYNGNGYGKTGFGLAKLIKD